MKRSLAVLALLVGSFVQLPTTFAANEQHAVVMLPSHGCSATVIDTGPGYSWLLGCGHAYSSQADYSKKMKFDIPMANPGQERKATSFIVAFDSEVDLSLVQLNIGPLDYKAPVAWEGWHEWNHRLLSVGYDEMKQPATMKQAHILKEEHDVYFTREKPWHGRSGGALIDLDSGYLVGVVSGYENPYKSPNTRGVYVSLPAIQKFLKSVFNRQQQPQQQLPIQQRQFWQPKQSITPQPCPGGR